MPFTPLNILLIDDDKDEYNLFSSALSKLDLEFSLHHSTSIVGIQEFIAETKPSIIFLDIHLPLKNGLYLLEEIKANAAHKHIPVVMYTVSTREHEIELAYKKGAHFFLIKPYSAANLTTSLKRIFNRDWTQPLIPPSFEDFLIKISFQ